MHKELFILSLAYFLFNGEMGRDIKEKLYLCPRKRQKAVKISKLFYYGSHHRTNTPKSHRQYERAAVEPYAATGRSLQAGSHH
jgi:hypothetical protein